MNYFIDVSFESINKYGEELCGDNVELVRTKDGVIIVMADGLGSGVKANILATLTSTIAVTMLKEGANIVETVDTIVNTLPVCSVRKIAYSTFTIIKVNNDGNIYIAEYDNPPFFLIPKNKNHIKDISIDKKDSIINGKRVKESNFKLSESDTITVVSDGVVHAGVGKILNLGWQWSNVYEHLKGISTIKKSAKNISNNLIEVCRDLYENKPGDDATVVCIKIRKPEIVNMFAGPPENKENDKLVFDLLMKRKGKKVICGGTASKIIANQLNEEITVDMDTLRPDIPPMGYVKGIDLVTEGVLTLSRTVDILKHYYNNGAKDDNKYSIYDNDGASKLAKLLIDDCTELNIIEGKAINPAHQNPDMPIDLSIKLKIITELQEILQKSGKRVNLISV